MKLSESNTHSFSVKQPNSQSATAFIDAEFYPENQNTTQLVDLYYKHDDEPDFDCEFLHGISQEYQENENITESESEDYLNDDYNDNEWDVETYDPYLESTYF